MNYYGLWSLLTKEVLRFLKVYHQTLFSPVVNSLLLLAIFSLSIGNRFLVVQNGISFELFMASGLVSMIAMQNSFANSSSSVVMSRVLGYIVDYLIPPLSGKEVLFAIVVGAMIRGILVSIIFIIFLIFFVKLPFTYPLYSVFYIIFVTLFLSILGVLCGIYSDSFDKMSAITSYFITPMTFLSGTFYSIRNLPDFWYNVALFNPFFYMIDGFRYSITGYHESNIAIGIIVILFLNIFLWIICSRMIESGYKIKS